MQQLYHDVKMYVIAIGDKITRNANALSMHRGNDTVQFTVSENHKTVQLVDSLKSSHRLLTCLWTLWKSGIAGSRSSLRSLAAQILVV